MAHSWHSVKLITAALEDQVQPPDHMNEKIRPQKPVTWPRSCRKEGRQTQGLGSFGKSQIMLAGNSSLPLPPAARDLVGQR